MLLIKKAYALLLQARGYGRKGVQVSNDTLHLDSSELRVPGIRGALKACSDFHQVQVASDTWFGAYACFPRYTFRLVTNNASHLSQVLSLECVDSASPQTASPIRRASIHF